MAKPPPLGMGTLLILLTLGLSTAPTLKDKNLTIGVKKSEINKAPIKTKT
ncbi:hypothetical protein [Streptococcus didelphis]